MKKNLKHLLDTQFYVKVYRRNHMNKINKKWKRGAGVQCIESDGLREKSLAKNQTEFQK